MNNDASAAAGAAIFCDPPYGDLALFKPILHPDD